MNQQVLEGNWNEIVGMVKEKWGQLTDNDLQEFKGDAQQLVGLIVKKTGQAREKIEAELNSLLSDGASVVSRAGSVVKNVAEHASAGIQHGYEQATKTVTDGYYDAERVVQQRPIESVAVAFGSGLIAGVIVGLIARSR